MWRHFASVARICAVAAVLGLSACSSLPQRDGVARLPGAYNFAFYNTHEAAARSFYAAHYTHFGAYEMLMAPEGPEPSEVQAFIDRVLELVADPPKFEPPAEIIAPQWSKLAYETGQSMDWTHMLHSQLYDILTDERIEDRRTAGERAITYYLSEPDAAFSTRGYGHRFMEGGGPWAGAFRVEYPDVNGILWAYHWHHAAVYEALMPRDPEEQAIRLVQVIQVFEDSVLADLPTEMPLTAEVAPEFSALFPAAAHIFDNLHMMHDVANDIMAWEGYTLAEKQRETRRMRALMSYAVQDTVEAPSMPMHHGDHTMSSGAMRVPTLGPNGWLPQGHPEARMATMAELMAPLPRPTTSSGGGAR